MFGMLLFVKVNVEVVELASQYWGVWVLLSELLLTLGLWQMPLQLQ